MGGLRILLLTASVMAIGCASGARDISDGWRLWPDTKASWENDRLYLPGDAMLAEMPVYPPTGGWTKLNPSTGMPVHLPTTVEEHYWGKLGSRPYTDEERDAGSRDMGIVNGNYRGVSWWWRTIQRPVLAKGERLVVALRGARMRAEVYCNGKLCGYQLIPELPFEADLTDAVRPGANVLAVRITDPGGRMDWFDYGTFKWGAYDVPLSHGFGGLDGGIDLVVRPSVYVSDLYVLNRPQPRTVHVVAEVRSAGPAYAGAIRLRVGTQDATRHVSLPARGTAKVEIDVEMPSAKLWTLEHPVLYRATASLISVPKGGRSVLFGFRWFTAQGVGADARLVLNGKRIVLRSAISWGFWGRNGIWPDAHMARNEVEAAKSLGLNCLHFHRNIGKTPVLDLQDRLGLLRYEEAGAGICALGTRYSWDAPPPSGKLDTSGAGGDPQTFAERLEEEKIVQMVRRDRSHPSLIEWGMYNEAAPDLRNPRVYRVLRRMHEEDPSRLIVLHSGVPPHNQAWMMPYDDTIRVDDGTGYSGYRDQHDGWVRGCYLDSHYRGPGDWTYRTDDRKEVHVWGEMISASSPDDHALVLSQERGDGFDLADHKRTLDGYERFLDATGFRDTFPTASSVFRAVGERQYFTWQKLIENARMADALDSMVINGWESMAVNHHCGLVDSYRNPKADPAIVRRACEPEVLVVRARHYVVAKGERVVVDVHLINEANRRGLHKLVLNARENGQLIATATVPVTVEGGDVYGQLLHAGFEFTAPLAGPITLSATLEPVSGRGVPLRRTEEMLAIDVAGPPTPKRIGVVEAGTELSDALQRVYGVKAQPVDTPALDAIVVAAGSANGGLYTTHAPIAGTDDPALFQSQRYGPAGTVSFAFKGPAPGKCELELLFAETYWDGPGKRVFDVAVNGKTVLTDLDIVAEAGGKNRALVKRLSVDAPDGTVSVTVPRVATDFALIAAAKITDSNGKVVTQSFRAEPYTDSKGVVWSPAAYEDGAIATLLDRVARDGLRLVFWPGDDSAAETFARALAAKGIVRFSGMVGRSLVSWMGSWYFFRKHWLFDGLPTGCSADWRYQIPDDAGGNGLLLSAPRMEVAAGYGRDHEPNVGIGACVIPYGKGKIVVFCMPGLIAGLRGDPSGIVPAVAQRLLGNALR